MTAYLAMPCRACKLCRINVGYKVWLINHLWRKQVISKVRFAHSLLISSRHLNHWLDIWYDHLTAGPKWCLRLIKFCGHEIDHNFTTHSICVGYSNVFFTLKLVYILYWFNLLYCTFQIQQDGTVNIYTIHEGQYVRTLYPAGCGGLETDITFLKISTLGQVAFTANSTVS